MPRLSIDEPPQHAVATGSYVDNAALRARRGEAKQARRRGSPSTDSRPTKKQKTRVHPSPSKQASAAVMYAAAKAKPKKQKR